MLRYPVTSRRSILHCPVHGCAVALAEDGRIASRCPRCKREVALALERWRGRRRRSLAAA